MKVDINPNPIGAKLLTFHVSPYFTLLLLMGSTVGGYWIADSLFIVYVVVARSCCFWSSWVMVYHSLLKQNGTVVEVTEQQNREKMKMFFMEKIYRKISSHWKLLSTIRKKGRFERNVLLIGLDSIWSQDDFKSRDENNKKIVLKTFPLTEGGSFPKSYKEALANVDKHELAGEANWLWTAFRGRLRCMLLQKLYWQLTFVDTRRSEMSSDTRKRFSLFAQLYWLTDYWKNVLSDICRAPVADWKQVVHFDC